MITPPPDQPKFDFKQLQQDLAASKDQNELFFRIANAPFAQNVVSAYLFLGLISFFVVEQASKTVKLAGVSDTEQYDMSVRGYDFDPGDFQLSLEDDNDNDIVKAINGGKYQENTDWVAVSRPDADPEQTRLNQANSGIAYNAVYPLNSSVKGALLFCYYQYPENIGRDQQQFMQQYSRLVSKAMDSQLGKRLPAFLFSQKG